MASCEIFEPSAATVLPSRLVWPANAAPKEVLDRSDNPASSAGVKKVLRQATLESSPLICRVPWYEPKAKRLFLMMGPPRVKPNGFFFRDARGFFARIRK